MSPLKRPLSQKNSMSAFRRTDVVKTGRLFIKKPSNRGFFKFKSWHEKLLILRDTWTETDQNGVTTLEIYNIDKKSKSEKIVTYSSSSLEKKNKTLLNSSPKNWPRVQRSQGCFSFAFFSEPLHPIEDCFIDLRTVTYVGHYSSSKSFQHSFILHRNAKDPLIFGSKYELESKEWQMALKHLTEKANQNFETNKKKIDYAKQNFEERLEKYFLSPKKKPPDFPFHENQSRCFHVSCSSYNQDSSSPIVDQLDGEFLLCVYQNGFIKILSKGKNISTDKSDKGFQSGEYTNNCPFLSLHDLQEKKEICSWKMDEIKKLKSEVVKDNKNNLILLETYKKCEKYPGVFRFRSKEAGELIGYVKEVASKMEKLSVSMSSQTSIGSKRSTFDTIKYEKQKTLKKKISIKSTNLPLSKSLNLPNVRTKFFIFCFHI